LIVDRNLIKQQLQPAMDSLVDSIVKILSILPEKSTKETVDATVKSFMDYFNKTLEETNQHYADSFKKYMEENYGK